MKFLVDMCLSPGIAQWLRGQGHDALHANDLSMHEAPDAEILRVASTDSRIVVTADLDFPRLLAILGIDGPGLILLRGGTYSELESLDCVRRVLMAIAPDELPRSIVVVDRERIRRRHLPI
jgi:predicted nuclease of predicted toxin-antitoxin system